MKGSGKGKGNERDLANVLKTEQGSASIEMIGTTEIVIEIEIEKRKETVAAIAIEHAIVVVTEIGRDLVIAIVTGRGIGNVIMKLVMLTMIVGVLVIGTMNMIKLNLNMSGIGKVKRKGTMIIRNRRIVMDGMSNLNVNTSVQKESMITDSMTTMIIIKVRGSTIIQMPRVMMTVIKILIDIMIDMIKWMKTIMIMKEQHMSHERRRGATRDQIGHYHASISSEGMVLGEF